MAKRRDADQVTAKDPDLVELYGRLGRDDAPLTPLLGDVQARMRVRRRGRRRAVVISAAAALVAVAAVAVGLRDRGESEIAAVIQQGAATRLTITRADGSTFAFADLTVECSADSGAETLQILSNRHLSGGHLTEPFLVFEAHPAVAGEADRVFRLPVAGGNDQRPFTLFFATEDDNEVSSAEPGASGTVEISSLSCGPLPAVDLVVNATLGSEVGEGPLKIQGALHY